MDVKCQSNKNLPGGNQMKKRNLGKTVAALCLVAALCVQSSGVVGASQTEAQEGTKEVIVEERKAQIETALAEAEELKASATEIPVSTPA
jgi:hypothetical protein